MATPAFATPASAPHILNAPRRVYWRRDLPPLDAEPLGEHTLEADSSRVSNAIASRSDLWQRGYDDLMKVAGARLDQEVRRLGGWCAHVLDERIEPKYDGSTNETWLHGRFSYVLYGARSH